MLPAAKLGKMQDNKAERKKFQKEILERGVGTGRSSSRRES